MVNWHDPEVIKKCMTAFADITLMLLGLYGWYYLHSFQVEKALLGRKIPFQWPLVPYMAGRIFFLVSLILSVVLRNPFAPYFDCHRALRFLAYSENVVIACASTNLVILSWSIWRSHRSVRVLLAVVTIGHWFTLIFDSWGSQISSSTGDCGYLVVNPMYSAVAATYTMIFDFFLMKLTILGLWRFSSSFSLKTALWSQGIVYFLIVFLTSFVPLVFSWLNLNYIMNIIFACPASCVMTIASSRAVNPMVKMPPSTLPRMPVVVPPELGKEDVRVTMPKSESPGPSSGLLSL